MPRTHIRRGRRLAAVGVVAALAVSLAGVSTGAASAENSRPAAKTGPVKVQLLSFNDDRGLFSGIRTVRRPLCHPVRLIE